jgi:hypothetical protein
MNGKRISTVRLDKHKTADPFATKTKLKTTFGTVYNAGGFPCRVQHTGNRMYLAWEIAPPRLDYRPLLITCAEGLLETEHPHVFVAPNAFVELCEAEGAIEKVVPLLPQLMPHIRAALAGSSVVTFENGLRALTALARCCGEALVQHLGVVLQQVNKKIFDRTMAPKITETLQIIEECGGPDAAKAIKAKVPTYTPTGSLMRMR